MVKETDIKELLKREDIPIYDQAIERAVVGNIMVDQSVQDLIIPQLREEYFFDVVCYQIAKTIIDMYREEKKIDLLTVKHNCNVDQVELVKIQGEGTGAININDNLSILKQLYFQRYAKRLSVVLDTLSKDKFTDVDDIAKIIDEATDEIDKTFGGGHLVNSLRENISISVESATERRELFKKGELPGIKTGFIDLDGILLGWQDSDLIIIAARPSMGKTSMCLHHARTAALKGKQVRIYSLEMSKIKLVDRILLSECGFKHYKFSSGDLTEENLEEIKEAAEKLKKLNIWIDDKAARSIESIQSDARYWKKEERCDMVIIDYLQLSEVLDEYARLTLNERTSRISRKAKAMAKELNVPVLLVSQLNRDIERRSGLKMPMLSDLRDSGAIEQDADVVLFIYRPKIYGDGECENVKNSYKIDSCDDMGFYIVAKNRNGPTGYVLFKHNESLTNLGDFEKQVNEEEPLPF